MSAAVDQVRMSRVEFERRLADEYQAGVRDGVAKEKARAVLIQRGPAQVWLTYGRLALNLITGTCNVGGVEFQATEGERRLLAILIKAQGCPVSDSAILGQLYPEDYDAADRSGALRAQVYRLRSALRTAGVPGIVRHRGGYMLAKPLAQA